jgi:menaquinone-dependent protoporphyrinogen oxidase
VSLAAHGDLENARAYVENFEQQTGWRPAQVGLFSGALLYRQYGFLKRLMMKKIVSDKRGGLSTDTSSDHVYTDWDEVKRFAEAFLERVVPQDASKIEA